MANAEIETDSIPFFGKQNKSETSHQNLGKRNESTPMAANAKLIEHYKIRECPGRYLIFSHFKFDNDELSDRNGTEVDVCAIENTFKRLGFQGQTYRDLDFDKLYDRLEKAFKDDYSECTSLFVFILTHGEVNGQLHAKDMGYDFDVTVKALIQETNETLIGRPKVFIMQACQGKDRDVGLATGKNDDENPSSILPIYSEFLMAFATPPGYVSYRNPIHGSWFIQSLCDAIQKNCEKEDFETILKIARRKVALEKKTEKEKFKQMPLAATTLTKTLFLTNEALQVGLRRSAIN